MRFTVNGLVHDIEALPQARLSDVLRNKLHLTGTKIGCNAGDCGACTVEIDGEIACACLVPVAQVEGQVIRTVEGLSEDTLSALQQSFLAHGAAQCGICTPGMLMSAERLLRDHPAPSRAQVEDALGGVLCRCTGYAKIIDAVMAANMPRATEEPAIRQAVGQRIERLDGVPKIDGSDVFGADHIPDNALHILVIRSPHHRARFWIGDTDGFLKRHPGLVAVFSAKDIPGRNAFGVIPAFVDQPVFAVEEARFRGEAVAAIVGDVDVIAHFDPADFPVTYEPMPPALGPAEALAFAGHPVQSNREHNVLVRGHVERGDAIAALAASTHQVQAHLTTPFIEHAYIEPEAGYAIREANRLTVFGCTQAPHMDRELTADILGLPRDAVRILPSACGGGFGSKLDLSFQPYVALAAWVLNRPVALAYSRSESMQSTTKRHPSDITIHIGCDGDGKLTATRFDGIFNTGAYASWGPTVANRVPVHASGPYFTPHYQADSMAVLTNCVPAGAFRGFGVPQSMIALETALDLLAEKAGLDALDFRLMNALKNGESTVTGQVFERGVGIIDCLGALQPHWRAAKERASAFNAAHADGPLRYGVGVATCWYGCGNTSLPNPSTIRIGIRPDGMIGLHQGAVDIGQGSNTVIAQIAADALGVPVQALTLIGADTDETPDAGKTSASRQTFVSGNAAKKAGEALRALILRMSNLGPETRLHVENRTIVLLGNAEQRIIPLDRLPPNAHGYVLMAEETYDPPTKPLDQNGQGAPYAQYGYGAQLVELVVDTRLGTVTLKTITAAHDVGRAINPLLVEGQIEGGIAQGIGLALMENYIPGRTENLHDYLIPTFGDMPEIKSIIVEVPDPEGPFGAKGLGEHVLIPTAPAILNAIRNATGALVTNLPATPDKVLAAIKAAHANGLSA
jgi:aldehyde oxidoreductase